MAGRHRSLESTRPQHRICHDSPDLGRALGLAALAVTITCQSLIAAGMQRATPPGPLLPGPPVPVAIRIPTLDVDTALVPLTVDAAGTLQPPASPDVAGWYTASSVPGDPGPAVIAGHVDSRVGPGIFIDLDKLEPGDEIQVVRSDGHTVSFRVQTGDTYNKDQFPTQSVYGPTPTAELRLITCGGRFDHRAGRYLANYVVYAEPA